MQKNYMMVKNKLYKKKKAEMCKNIYLAIIKPRANRRYYIKKAKKS